MWKIQWHRVSGPFRDKTWKCKKEFGANILLHTLWDFTASNSAQFEPQRELGWGREFLYLGSNIVKTKINTKKIWNNKKSIKLWLLVKDVLHSNAITCNHMLEFKGSGMSRDDISSLESFQKWRTVTKRRNLPLIFPARPARTITLSFTIAWSHACMHANINLNKSFCFFHTHRHTSSTTQNFLKQVRDLQ